MTITSQPKASMWAYCIHSWFLWVNYAISSEKYKHNLSTQGIYEIPTRGYCIHFDIFKVCVIPLGQPKHKCSNPRNPWNYPLESIAYTSNFVCNILIQLLTKKLIVILNIAWANNFKFLVISSFCFFHCSFRQLQGQLGKQLRR